MLTEYRIYVKDFLQQFDFPQDAEEPLLSAFDLLTADPDRGCALTELLAAYAADCNVDFSVLIARADTLAKQSGIHPYTVHLLVLILLAKECLSYYRAAGFDKEMWRANLMDLKYKAVECKLIKGMWGTFVFAWFARFYNVSRFCFGPLQFEIVDLRKPYKKNGVTYPAGTKVLNTHIPRTGGRLLPDAAEDAFRTASIFFKERYGLSETIFVCESWLLFPRNLTLLKPTSNLHAFVSRFDIIEAGEYDDYGSVWRLFDTDYNGDPDALPQDSSLRRAYVALMKRGEKTGWGYGAFLYK